MSNFYEEMITGVHKCIMETPRQFGNFPYIMLIKFGFSAVVSICSPLERTASKTESFK